MSGFMEHHTTIGGGLSFHQRSQALEADLRGQAAAARRHQQVDLLEAAVALCASVSARNRAHGQTPEVKVPRALLEALEAAVDEVSSLRVSERRAEREGRRTS